MLFLCPLDRIITRRDASVRDCKLPKIVAQERIALYTPTEFEDDRSKFLPELRIFRWFEPWFN